MTTLMLKINVTVATPYYDGARVQETYTVMARRKPRTDRGVLQLLRRRGYNTKQMCVVSVDSFISA